MRDLSNKSIIHIKKDGVEYIQFKELLKYNDKITHAYTIGLDKNYRRTKNKQSQKNYKDLCNSIGVDYEKLVYSNQFHTDIVENVKDVEDFIKKDKKVDGLYTNKKGIALSTINADCILLLFYDPKKNVIANTHSGWKGTLQRISVKTVRKMKEEYNCNPEDIICCISPSIRKCHFEVEEDVKNLYENEFKDIKDLNEAIIETQTNKKWHIDTVLINKMLLIKAGLQEQNIIDSEICTVCNKEQIHSYRVEKEGYGVETAIIGLKE